MQHQGSVQNLPHQTSQQSLSPPYNRDQQYQQQYSLGRHKGGGQPSPYMSRHGSEGERRSHDPYLQNDRNINTNTSQNMAKVDNLDRIQRNTGQDPTQYLERSVPRHTASHPHSEHKLNLYSPGDGEQNVSYDSRLSSDQSGHNLSQEVHAPRVSRHESQQSINYSGQPEMSYDRNVSRHESQRSLNYSGRPEMMQEMHDQRGSQHESRRAMNYLEQPYHQSSHLGSTSQSHQLTESPYTSRLNGQVSNQKESSYSQRQQEFTPNVPLQNQPISATPMQKELSPPSRQPPSPYVSQDQRSMLQHDAPPSPYMSRHQGASPDSPYLSRNINQRSVGQHTEVSSHSNVSRHASQRSVSAPNKNYSQTDVYHYDEYQAPSATSTLNRQSHYPLPSAQPSATSTLLRQSHDHPRTHPNEPPSATSTLIRRQHHPATHPNEPPSATSTLTRGQQYSQGSPHQNTSQFYGSQTSVNQRPLYTRQDSEPPPPYLTHSRQPSRSYDNHDTDQNINREHSYPQQSEERQHSQSVSRSQSRLSHQQDQRITPKLTRNESERSLARTQQSGYSQHSRASSLSNSHPIPDAWAMEASHIINLLEKEIVYLTGGRDRQGGPVITFPPHRQHHRFSAEDITVCLKYFAQIPSEESKRRGITVVIDSRDGSWSNLVTVLGCLKESLEESLKQVFVVKQDNAVDRRPSSNSFRRDRPNIEPQLMSVNRLYTFVDRNQLTGMFSGTLSYHHGVWLRNRLDLEKFIRETRAASNHLDNVEYQIYQRLNRREPSSPLESARQHKHLQQEILTVPSQVITDGKELLNKLHQHEDTILPGDEEPVSTLDHLESQKQVKRLIQSMDNRIDKLQNLLEDEDRSVITNQKFEDLQRHIKAILSWILGPGEKLLALQTDIGDSHEIADDLRKRHEELEIKCTDTYDQYAELRHKAEELIAEDPTGADDVRSTRDYMDTVFRSFASRLERRRNLLITSVRFHRLSEEFSKKLDDLLELVCSEPECMDVTSAEKELKILEEKCDAINNAAQSTLSDGQSLLDEMSRPIKNASGKDITPDYARHIKHINQSLEEIQERKMRSDELADVRKLKLQQILQLCTCEQDAEQAIAWILELCEVMANTHTNMGKTHEEAEKLLNDHKKFETTAQSTYEYGKQLLQAALVLRRSLRHNLEPNTDMTERLQDAWGRFSQGTNERAKRLTVSSMFLASIEKKSRASVCTICEDREINTAIDPCGHTMCRVCATEVMSRNRKCPVCRSRIKKTIKIYFS